MTSDCLIHYKIIDTFVYQKNVSPTQRKKCTTHHPLFFHLTPGLWVQQHTQTKSDRYQHLHQQLYHIPDTIHHPRER